MDYANSYSSGYGSGDYSYTPSKPKATTSVADKKGYTPVSSTAKATTASAKKYQTTYSSKDNYESPSSSSGSSRGLGAPTTKPKTKVAAPTIQEKFASAYTSAGGTFNSYTARPDPISVYDSPDFKTVEDYLNKTAIEDALYDAQGIINQAYTPQMNMETRRMTEEEIKKFAPVKELTDKGITVEELASMDAPMQKATLESLGITNAKWVSSQGMYPMSEEKFDKATMESVHYGRDTGVFDRISPQEPELNEPITTPATPKAGYLPKTVDTGNGLMSSPRTKPTASTTSISFYMDIGKYGETDHGSVPQPTKDDREKHLPISKRTKDIGYGHKVTAQEEATGYIQGVKFKNDDGTYKALTSEEKAKILQADMAFHQNMARKHPTKGWDKKLEKLGSSWEELDEPYRNVLTSLSFNVGGAGGAGYTKVLEAAVNKDVVSFAREIRRKDNKRNTAGMDNRAAKELYYAGLIKNLSEVKDVLPLADHRSGIPK